MCVFCLEARKPEAANGFLGEAWPYQGRILAANSQMFAVPGYGPQVYPYILLISRRHFGAFSDATSCERTALFDLLEELRHRRLLPNRPVRIFEHGGCLESTAACIDHFHWHVVSDNFDLEVPVREDFQVRPVTVDQCRPLDATGRYLLTGLQRPGQPLRGVVAEPTSVESQYFRQRIAEELGEGV